ncbi:hypothetical protein D3C80_1263270 [compost metagenome]
MHQRAALGAGEHGRSQFLFNLWVAAGEDQSAAWTTQCLVGSSRNYVRQSNRVGIQPRRYQAGHMGHVNEQVRAHLIGNLAETGKVEHLRVGRKTRDDHLWPVLQRQALDFVVIDQPLAIDSILHGVVQLAGRTDLCPMGKVAAVSQTHAQDGVAGVEQGQVHRCVGRRARMWLNVGIIGAEQRTGAIDRQLFNNIDVLAATVVTLGRVAFSVLVGQRRALRCHDLRAGVVFRGDQFDMVFLATGLAVDCSSQGGVKIGKGQAFVEHGIFPGSMGRPHGLARCGLRKPIQTS